MEETYLQVWQTAGKFDPTMSPPMSWMVAIAPSDTNELDDLFDSDGYARHVDERSE